MCLSPVHEVKGGEPGRFMDGRPVGECDQREFGNPGNVDLKLFYAIFRQADSMQSKSD